MVNRYVYSTLFLALSFCGILFFMFYSWKLRSPHTGSYFSMSLNYGDFTSHKKREVSYDRLLHYILHPQAHCKVFAILGGKMMQDQKVDGDKIVCLKPGPGFSKNCTVYSFGINNEWSFDEAMNGQFGCKVYSFDPSMKMSDHLHKENMWFYNVAIGDFNHKLKVRSENWIVMTFDAILKKLGHFNKTIDMLKMDIEGSEFPTLEDILNKKLLTHVNHLCIEFHLMENPNWDKVFQLLKRIEAAGFNHFSTRNNSIMQPMMVPGLFRRYEQHYFEMAWFRL